ncbi:MAG: hypothetical protein WC481_05815 [Candidatus Omnitrophota bacterium]
MKGIYKIAAIALFILWFILLWLAPVLFTPKDFSVPTGEDSIIKSDDITVDASNAYSTLIESIKSPFAASRYQQLLDRNLFIKPETPPPVFTPDKLKVVSIGATNLPFIYTGFIQKQDGTIIGQINWSGKTYFAKKGEKFKDYKVLEINSKQIRAENKDGQLTLEFKKPVKSKELIGKLFNSMDDKTYEVKKGDDINGYKVLDIKADSVIIYGQDQEWVIKKGR